ncbi:SDR family oxidoreductase [Spirochaetota bacterium]
MILYVGATGLLGGKTVEELVKRGKKVRCLVRKGSDSKKLKKLGVELVTGDVRNSKSIKKALAGVSTVISSFATNMSKDKRVSNLWENDYEGNLSLIKFSKEAGVKKFIFTSYWGLAKFGNFEHGKIKKLVEDLLMVSGFDYTILRITTLATDMSLFLGKRLMEKGKSPILMKKYEKVRPILLKDLSWCIADSIDNLKASNKIIEIAGEEEYTFLELEQLFRKAMGRRVRFIFIPLPLANFAASFIDFITKNKYNARGMVSAFTGGSTCDIKEMKNIFKIEQGSFENYLIETLSTK